MEEEQQQQNREDPSSKSGVDEEEKLGGNEENGGDWTTSILLLGLWGVLMFYVFNLTPNQTPVSSTVEPQPAQHFVVTAMGYEFEQSLDF